MLSIKLVTVGKIKDKFIVDGIAEFTKRISKFAKLEIVVVKEEKIDSSSLIKEAESISKYINKGYNIILDIHGKKASSLTFAKSIKKVQQHHSIINIVIGSSHGLHKSIKEKADEKISFSDMTFPHQLFQLIVVEQIYRALSINNNGKYHK